MISYIDAFLCKLHRATEPIHSPALKFGGAPILFHIVDWPKCRYCGQELEFLAQIPLQEPLRLSNLFSMAYVFMCPGKFDERGWLICHTWEANSGANLVLLQKKGVDIISFPHASDYPDYQAELIPAREAVIDTSLNLDEVIRGTIHLSTKIGGTPFWLQYSEQPNCPKCGGQMKLIAQIDAELDGPLPADPKEWNTGKYKFFHFGGDDGFGYVFLCENECDPGGAGFLWQCT
jgi:uncharacterized protein YwqG